MIFKGMAELLWVDSTKDKVLGYSLIISWRSRGGTTAGENASFFGFFFRKKLLVYDVKKCIFVELRIRSCKLCIIRFDYGN